jgi:N-acyl-D-amino-acid deacylase
MRIRPFLILLLAALALPLLTDRTRAVPFAPEFDLVIRQGRVIDGSGNPWYVADVGIRDGRIVAVGYFDVTGARHVMDAKGLVVAPGFIDVHTHVEDTLQKVPTADNFLFDGVTSVITGNCGGSRTEVSKWFGELRQNGISINLASLIGHNGVRREVMGTEQRDPTSEEQVKMEALVERAMREGAVGFSTGLIYIPGTYSKTAEVIGLARGRQASWCLCFAHSQRR